MHQYILNVCYTGDYGQSTGGEGQLYVYERDEQRWVYCSMGVDNIAFKLCVIIRPVADS